MSSIPLHYDVSFSTTPVENVLLLASSVDNFEKYANANSFWITYDHDNTRTELLELLRSKTVSIKRLCFIDHYREDPLFLNSESFFHDSNRDFIVQLIQEFHVEHVDFLACNTLQSEAWKSFYGSLSSSTNVIVGASNDNTGNLKNGGDWVLETTMEDIQTVYFNESIVNYAGLLTTFTVDNIVYTVLSSTYPYTARADKYNGAGTAVIPETVTNGATTYTVIKVGDGSQVFYTGQVIFPSTITELGGGVFKNCGPNTYDFTHCTGLTTIPSQFSHNGTGPKSLKLPWGVNYLADDIFNMFSYGISNLTLPSSLNSSSMFNRYYSNNGIAFWHSSSNWSDAQKPILQEFIMFDQLGNHYTRKDLSSYPYLLYKNPDGFQQLANMIINFSTEYSDTTKWELIVPPGGIAGLESGGTIYDLTAKTSSTEVHTIQYNSTDISDTSLTLAVGTKHHIAMTYDSGSVDVYINGQLQVDGASSAASYSSFVLNRGNDIAGNSTHGFYDDVQVFPNVLTNNEIQSLYANPDYHVFLVTANTTPKYVLNSVVTPLVRFVAGHTYVFDQSHTSNTGHPLVIGTMPDNQQSLVSYQTVVGTPGQPGAYTTFTATEETVYYFSYETPDMGFAPPTYTVKTVENVVGQTVFALKGPGETDFVIQPDLSFGAGDMFMFDVSDPTMNGFNLVFGTTVDDSSTIQSQYYSQNGDVIMLSIPSDYSGNALKYFEDTSAGMGYVPIPPSYATLTGANGTHITTPVTLTKPWRMTLDVSNFTGNVVGRTLFASANSSGVNDWMKFQIFVQNTSTIYCGWNGWQSRWTPTPLTNSNFTLVIDCTTTGLTISKDGNALSRESWQSGSFSNIPSTMTLDYGMIFGGGGTSYDLVCNFENL